MIINTENVKNTGEFYCPCCGEELYRIETLSNNKLHTANFYCVICEGGFLIEDTLDINPEAEQEILLDKYYIKFMAEILADMTFIKNENTNEKEKLKCLNILIRKWYKRFNDILKIK